MKNTRLLCLCVTVSLLVLACATVAPEKAETPVAQPKEVTMATTGGQAGISANRTENKPPQIANPAPLQPEVTQPQEAKQPAEVKPLPEVTPAPAPAPPAPPLPEPKPIPEEPALNPHKYQELALFALDLINKDRKANGLDPVLMDGNPASQTHAEENLANSYSSHWSMDGMKPYMRYTVAGGVNSVRENVLGTGTSGGPVVKRDPKEMLAQAEQEFMNSPRHRATILYKWNKKVSLGIAFNDSNLSYVQHFEGDYIGFSDVPAITGTVLSMAGRLKAGKFAQIAIYYDPLPQPLTPQQLDNPPYDSSYSLGDLAGNVLSPPPPGAVYTNLSPTDVVATAWDVRSEGWFNVKADISKLLTKGNGVYTIAVVADMNGEFIAVSNYSVFIK